MNNTVLLSRRIRSGLVNPPCITRRLVKLTQTLLQLIRNQNPQFGNLLSLQFMAEVMVRTSSKKIKYINKLLAYMYAHVSAFEFEGMADDQQELFYNEIMRAYYLPMK